MTRLFQCKHRSFGSPVVNMLLGNALSMSGFFVVLLSLPPFISPNSIFNLGSRSRLARNTMSQAKYDEHEIRNTFESENKLRRFLKKVEVHERQSRTANFLSPPKPYLKLFSKYSFPVRHGRSKQSRFRREKEMVKNDVFLYNTIVWNDDQTQVAADAVNIPARHDIDGRNFRHKIRRSTLALTVFMMTALCLAPVFMYVLVNGYYKYLPWFKSDYEILKPYVEKPEKKEEVEKPADEEKPPDDMGDEWEQLGEGDFGEEFGGGEEEYEGY